jgi:hypothetical protein
MLLPVARKKNTMPPNKGGLIHGQLDGGGAYGWGSPDEPLEAGDGKLRVMDAAWPGSGHVRTPPFRSPCPNHKLPGPGVNDVEVCLFGWHGNSNKLQRAAERDAPSLGSRSQANGAMHGAG